MLAANFKKTTINETRIETLERMMAGQDAKLKQQAQKITQLEAQVKRKDE